MTEQRTLIREVVMAAPDGTATKRIERVEVEIRWPGAEEPYQPIERYVFRGE